MRTPEQSTSERSIPVASSAAAAPTAKPQRVLACVLCQQRKVKCDRKFPCANCVKSNAKCVPAATLSSRQRRRRFPERQLLDRLRHYESLLRQNDIRFEPLHSKDASTIDKQLQNTGGGREYEFPDDDQSGAAADRNNSWSPSTAKSETVCKAKNFWHAMSQRSPDSDEHSSDSSLDEFREAVVKKTWKQLHQRNDHLLFGLGKTDLDLSTLHPEQVHIFKLWQIYLDNVNPLLKVTHTPTLQGSIIDAASNVASIKPSFAAVMFSIYCVSILSIEDDECRTMFDSSKEDLLMRYQFGCQQALLNCGFLSSGDLECLTALYLYLVSVRPSTDPQSLSSILGLGIRIAQRMGLHTEATYAKCTALEAEKRRRLWWSLILFDTRICEMADYRTAMLVPTWDCRIPLNVNDFDLQPEMKDPPAVLGKSTEALFAVVWSEMGEFLRNSAFFLDFTTPALKIVAKDVQRGPIPEGGEVVALEKMIEEKYLRFCNPENPLQFMTIWTARGHLAKYRLVETFSRFSRSATEPTDVQREASISYALTMLECDTKLMTSPLTKGYLWHVKFYFPFPAYFHLILDLRKRPFSEHAEQTWETMSDNYDARSIDMEYREENPFFKIFAKTVLQAWEAREASLTESEKSIEPPRIITDIRRKTAQPTQDLQNANIEQSSGVLDMSNDDFPMSMPMDFGSHGMLYGIGGQNYKISDLEYGQTIQAFDANHLNWEATDWNTVLSRGW